MTARATIGRTRRLAADLGRLVVGRRAGDGRWSLRSTGADVRAYLTMVRADRRGDARGALEVASGLAIRRPTLRWPLRVASDIGMRRGGLTAPLDATRRLRALDDSPALRTRERVLEGRLAETADGWLPAIDGPSRPLEPRSSGVVLHLLKASLPERQSGYTIRSRETLRAQRDVGLEPIAVTPYGYPPAGEGSAAPVAVAEVDGVPHHRICPGCPEDELRSDEALRRTAAGAAEIAVRERPALIQAASGYRGYELALVGLALRQHLRRPLVYEVRGFLESAWTQDPELAETAEWSRRRIATEDRVLAAADGVTTLSAAMRDELVARGVAADRIAVVPNGIDPAAFTPTEPDPELRRRYGLEGRWVFGYVSNLDHPREGQELLIDATARLVRMGRPVTCLLVGDGSRRASLEARAAAAGVSEAVVFTGRVPHTEVAAHYALLDAFVIPRLPDRAARFTTPLKPYEAMAMARPLVVSDVEALLEIAAPDERGLAFPSGDVAALVAVLSRLMDDRGLGGRLGEAGRAWVLAERTWAADGTRYRDFYASVLERFDRSSRDA